MEWSDTYRIGIPTVDTQHKHLYRLIRELKNALREGLQGSDVEKILVSLDQYKTRHFQLEEKYMQECNYPGLAEQQEEHAYFMNRFAILGRELKETGMTSAIVQTILGELSDWLEKHVNGLDMEFGKYYQQWSQMQEKAM